MNAEYLLDAIGRLDDDLVKEAENYRRPKVRYGRLLGLAASFAVVLLLGYGATHFGMGGGASISGNSMAPTYSGGGNGGAPARGGDMAQGGSSGAAERGDGQSEMFDQTAAQHMKPASPGGDWSPDSNAAGLEVPGQSADGKDSAIDLNGEAVTILLRTDGSADRHTFLLRGGQDRVLDELPDGCVALGSLERTGETERADVPYTEDEAYVGRPVWLLAADPETPILYVELPEGSYLEFR